MSDVPMDVRAILEALPHRHPMLLVDRVVELSPGRRIVAVKCVSVNEPFFPGHFPAAPIMPGVLIVEAMAQAGGLLAFSAGVPTDAPGRQLLLLGVDRARFRKPVVPGDRLEMEITVLQERRGVYKLDGKARVDGKLVAEAELLVAAVSAP